MLRRLLSFFGLVLIPFFASSAVTAEEGGSLRLLHVDVEEKGLYEFCLSFEDARVQRDAREQAISRGLSLSDYRRIAPNTRCYKNTISFIPLQPEPRLDGVGYVYRPHSQGRYDCPGAANGRRCVIETGNTTYIKAQLLYGSMRFPVYVSLSNAQLTD